MRALVIAMSIYLAAASFALAQEPATKTMEWQPFAPRGEEFSTELPRLLDIKPGDPSQVIRTYRERYKSTFFFVYSVPIKSVAALTPQMNILRGHQATPQLGMIGTILAEKYEFDADGFHHRALRFATPTRAYLLQTAAEAADDAAEHFFSSLNIGGMNQSDPPHLEPMTFTKQFGTPQARPQTAQGPSPTPTITEKPRPAYTDAARAYGVAGAVSLRVTFLANGTIGDITLTETLPFGL